MTATFTITGISCRQAVDIKNEKHHARSGPFTTEKTDKNGERQSKYNIQKYQLLGRKMPLLSMRPA